jgi:uncharacterized spore protein YtfJ
MVPDIIDRIQEMTQKNSDDEEDVVTDSEQ